MLAWSNDAESMSTVRRMCPNVDYNQLLGVDAHLAGAECLVFFLNGINGRGFSKNPSNPFIPAQGDESRDGPFYEFKESRLIDLDGDGYFEYADALETGKPYLYACSDGQGFKRIPEKDSMNNPNPNCGAHQDLQVFTNVPVSPDSRDMTFVYTRWADTTNGAPDPTKQINYKPQNLPIKYNSYQIISAGLDGEYGLGGMVDETNQRTLQGVITWLCDSQVVAAKPPAWQYYNLPVCNPGIVDEAAAKAKRKFEADNITNW